MKKTTFILHSCVLVVIFLCLTTTNVFARTESVSKTYYFDFIENNPDECFQILRQIALKHVAMHWHIDGSSKDIFHKEDIGRYREKDATHSRMHCTSNGALKLSVKTNSEDGDGWIFLRMDQASFLEQRCENILKQGWSALKHNKISLLQSINKELRANNSLIEDSFSRGYPCDPITFLYAIEIRAKPSGARIQIMDIKEKYYPGIKIRAGMHKIRISKPGYITQNINLQMSSDDGYLDVTLKRDKHKVGVTLKSDRNEAPVNAQYLARTLRSRANQGNDFAQFYLGVMYYRGWGVSEDKSKAIFWFKKSAAQGFPKAKFTLKQLGM